MPRKTPGTALTKAPGGALVGWKARLAELNVEETQRAQEDATGASPRITFGPAGISFNKGDPVPSFKGFILATQQYREYYDQPYDEKNPTGPKCYAYGTAGPHEKAFEPQAEACKNCQWNEFDSNPNGRGSKACSEVARMAVLHIDDLKKDLKKVEPVVGRVSVLNRKVLSKFKSLDLPQSTVVSVTCKPVKGSSVSYDLDIEAGNEAQMSDEAGIAFVALVELAKKKFSEPMPDYKAPTSGGGSKKRRYSTK